MRRALMIAAGGVAVYSARSILRIVDLAAMIYDNPEMFDGPAANASIAICIEDYEREGWQ